MSRMLWTSQRVHSATAEEGNRTPLTTPIRPTTEGSVDPQFSNMIHQEEGSKGVTPQGSIDLKGGGEGGHGDDNIMLGFQNLSISCDDPPQHIVANVSGFVVKGTLVS